MAGLGTFGTWHHGKSETVNYSDRHLREYVAHRAELVDYASTILGDRARGEDLVQEAWMRLNALPPDRPIDQPFFYMRRIVRNLAIDWVRKIGSEKKLDVDQSDLAEIADQAPSHERTLIDRQNLAIVMRAMDELPEPVRIALEMHRFEGRKLSEIAGRLGVSVAQAHNLVYQGLDHCRRRLAEGT